MIRALLLALVLAFGLSTPSWALDVFACEPEWAALAREILEKL